MTIAIVLLSIACLAELQVILYLARQKDYTPHDVKVIAAVGEAIAEAAGYHQKPAPLVDELPELRAGWGPRLEVPDPFMNVPAEGEGGWLGETNPDS